MYLQVNYFYSCVKYTKKTDHLVLKKNGSENLHVDCRFDLVFDLDFDICWSVLTMYKADF